MLTLQLIFTNHIKLAHIGLFNIGINVTLISNTIKKFFQLTFNFIELIITHIEITSISVCVRRIAIFIFQFSVYFQNFRGKP